MVPKEEFIERLSAMHSDMISKLKNRPTLDYLKKVLRLYDEKIEIFNSTLNEQVEKLDRNYTDQDRELATLDKEVDGC